MIVMSNGGPKLWGKFDYQDRLSHRFHGFHLDFEIVEESCRNKTNRIGPRQLRGQMGHFLTSLGEYPSKFREGADEFTASQLPAFSPSDILSYCEYLKQLPAAICTGVMKRRIISECCYSKSVHRPFNPVLYFASRRSLTLVGEGTDDPPYADVPNPCRRKSERKPYPTPMKILIRRAKEEKEIRKARPCRVLEKPPNNGLLVPELIGVAHQVYQARQSLLFGLRKLINVIPVQRCRYYALIFALIFSMGSFPFL